MHNKPQLLRIQSKLEQMKQQDKEFSVFGAERHQYRLHQPKKESELSQFEAEYGIQLPSGYRDFLLTIGNGGAGPYYGLEKLEDGLYVSLDQKEMQYGVNNISGEFKFTTAWNLEFNTGELSEAERIAQEELYFDSKWADGLLGISNFGCGVSIHLVVHGESYGEIWVDDRANDGGIYPDEYFGNTNRLHFLDWYELWLDLTLEELAESSPAG